MKNYKKFSLIYSTTKDLKSVEKISKHIIKNKLAACINTFPIKSIYHWKGKVEKEKEYAMIIKTRKNLVKKLIKEIKSKHPYELPSIISFDINYGYKNFLRWIECETRQTKKQKKNFQKKAR